MFSSIWSMALFRISAWNAGHKPPSWKKAGGRAGRRAVRQFSWGASFRSSVLHASLHPQSMFPPTEAAPLALCLRFHFWEPQCVHAYVQTWWRKQRQRTTVTQRDGNFRNLDNSFDTMMEFFLRNIQYMGYPKKNTTKRAE